MELPLKKKVQLHQVFKLIRLLYWTIKSKMNAFKSFKDFKSIHQKETSKMESIIDFQKRLHQRHMSLSSEQSRLPLAAATTVAAAAKPIGRSPSVSSGIPRISTALPKPHIAPSKENNAAELNAKKIRPNNQSTPKVATVLTAQSSNIPVPTVRISLKYLYYELK